MSEQQCVVVTANGLDYLSRIPEANTRCGSREESATNRAPPVATECFCFPSRLARSSVVQYIDRIVATQYQSSLQPRKWLNSYRFSFLFVLHCSAHTSDTCFMTGAGNFSYSSGANLECSSPPFPFMVPLVFLSKCERGVQKTD